MSMRYHEAALTLGLKPADIILVLAATTFAHIVEAAKRGEIAVEAIDVMTEALNDLKDEARPEEPTGKPRRRKTAEPAGTQPIDPAGYGKPGAVDPQVADAQVRRRRRAPVNQPPADPATV